jgi:AcrR family transcriptional regulator
MGILERRQREKEQRRNGIIDAAERVFFSKGLESATMDDVAEEAELSKGTLYLYFKSKQDLYLAITRRGLEILTGMFRQAIKEPECGMDKIYAVGRAYCEFSRKFPDYFRAMMYFDANVEEIVDEESNARACERQGEEALMVCVDALQQGVKDSSIRPDIDPMKVAVILWGQTSGILHLISMKRKQFEERFEQFPFDNVTQIVDDAFDMMRRSVEPQKQGDTI